MDTPVDPRWPEVLSLTAHEIRTPLTVLAGYMRMVLKNQAGPLNAQHRMLLELAEKASARISELLEEVSDLSDLEDGTAPMNKQTTDLQAAVRAAVAHLPPMPDHREVVIHLELGSEPAPFNGAPVRLTQAFGSILWALRRELVGEHGLTVREKRGPGTYELLFGDPDTIAALETEPNGAREIFNEWRGGVGLTLPVARRVLNAHGAQLYAAPGGAKAGARILFRSA